MLIETTASFPDSKKEVVSGVDMLVLLSILILENYGEKIRLAAIEKVRWPYPLLKEEEALIKIEETGKRDFGGINLRFLNAEMIGVISKKVVMYGVFTIID